MRQDQTEAAEPAHAGSISAQPIAQPLVSLCMIARDNEQTIRDALASAKPWVDEMIVVDTGSTDSTPQIAEQMGARVEHYPWCDDFAAARNQSLQYATGRWLFWMDTDDTFPMECGRQLRETLSSEHGVSDDTLGLIMQVHCPPTATDARANEVGQVAGSIESVTVVDHVKVIRNLPDLRFEGRIHEQILPAIRRAGGRVMWTDSYVVHSGSDHSPEGIRRKLERDLRLLRMDAEERPGHPFVLFNLGMTLLHRSEYNEARETLERCIDQSTTDESHLRKAYALLVDTLDHLGDNHGACRRCWEGLGRYRDDPELAFKLGRLLMLCHEWKAAIEAFQRILSGNPGRYFASIDPGIKGYKTFANLATCHEELGQWNEAIGAWRVCLNDRPGLVDAWEGILRSSRELNDPRPLIQFAEELKETPAARCFVSVCQCLILDAQREFPEAVRQFEGAIEADEGAPFTLNEYARFLNEHEQWEASLPVLRKLRELNPTNPSPHFNLGLCQYQLGHYTEAANALQAALQLRPGHQPTYDLLRRCLAQLPPLVQAISSPPETDGELELDRGKAKRDHTYDRQSPSVSEEPAQYLQTDQPSEEKGAARQSNNTRPPRTHGRRVIITACLIRHADPQRGKIWDENGDLAFVVDHWLRGLNEHGLSGIILYDGLTDDFVAERDAANITFHPLNQSEAYPPNDQRFRAIREHLEIHPGIEQAFCTDLFDVRIANNPFELMSAYGPLCVGTEPSTIGENTWLHHQWHRVFGDAPPEKLRDKTVLNTGIFGGRRDHVIDLCRRMESHIEQQIKPAHVADMPTFNHVLYNEIGEDCFWANQEPLHSVFKSYEYERDDVAFIHK